MTKKKNKLIGLRLCFLLLILLTSGCDWLFNTNQTKSGSGSSSGTTPQDQPAHGQVTYNILEKSPFNGQQLNATFWTNLEGYCKAGPTQLIIADMDFIPQRMREAGFDGSDSLLWYVLSRTVSGANWSPQDNADAQVLKDREGEINAYWDRYIARIVQIMQKYPKTTAVIIVNDGQGQDRGGRSLGRGTYPQMSSVSDRVSMGDTADDKSPINFKKGRSR